MNTSEWLRPGLYGVAIGAIAVSIAGFSWGGWMTGGAADKMARGQAKREVVAALAPICVEQSKRDPQVEATLALMRSAVSYKRSDMVIEAGWATMPGSSDPDRQVASACTESLTAEF